MHHPEVSLGKQALHFTPIATSDSEIYDFLGMVSSFGSGVLFVVLMFGVFMACSKFDLLTELEQSCVKFFFWRRVHHIIDAICGS